MPVDFNAESPVFYLDGKRWDGEIGTVTLDVTAENSLDGCVIFDREPLTITFTFPKMSRKRFVKLLMSQGKSRNEANAFARTFGGNYCVKYMNYAITRRIV